MEDKPKLLIVDDDEEICTQMKWAFMQDYEVFIATDRPSAHALFEVERPAVVTLDLGLPPHAHGVAEGFCTLHDLLEVDASTKVVVITGHEGRQHALQAVGEGAYDFFHKPIHLDELKVVIRRALHVYQLEQEHRAMQHTPACDTFEGMLGSSASMQEVFATIRKVATTDASVLIVGESGTGKEMVAQAIHRRSQRRERPFVPINCGAIPEHLLESELFGHEKGAFTGAHMQRKGRLEMAHRGTLFLDEIGELSPPLQVKLLRVLQEQQLERVGGREAIAINARVLAATNTDLEQAIAEGRFRDDLYYRLGVVVLALPPLRERTEDIPLLAEVFLQRYSAESKQKISGFSRHAMSLMQTHSWPGNVRELDNRIKRAVIMAQGPHLTPSDLGFPSKETPYPGQTLKEAREAIEKALIVQALAKHNGQVTRTAAALGISRSTMHELIARYRIKR